MKKMPKGYTKFDAADYLRTGTDIVEFLRIASEHNDAEHLADALGVVARARGMSRIAKKTGLTRAALYTALSDKGNPSLSTLLKVLDALGLKIAVAAK